MIFLYIVYFGLVFAIIGRLIYHIVTDSSEYRRYKLNSKAQPILAVPAQITVIRRESSGLTSFAAWDIYLNEKNIGSISDGSQVTAQTRLRTNELKAKDSHRAFTPPLKFIAQSGCNSEVRFNGGKFQSAQGMSLVLADGPEGASDTSEGFKPRWRVWMLCAVLMIGYYAGVFFLCSVQIVLPFVLAFLPVLVSGLVCRYFYRGLADYLSYNHSEEWVGINRDLSQAYLFRNLIFHDNRIDDMEYLEIKIQYERVLCVLFLSGFAWIAVMVYIFSNAAG